MIQATLCFLVDDLPASRVLLGLKQRGLGAGMFNGFGGKVEAGETVLETAVREMVEESAVQVNPTDMRQMGQFTFYMPAKPEWDMEVYAYVATRWTGNPQASPEMVPQWFAVTDVPYAQMWADDAYWLPRVLAGEQLTGVFTFAADNVTLASWKLEETRF